MGDTTVKLTRQQILAKARARWGAAVQLREDRNAPTPAEKAAAAERGKARRERKAAIDAEMKALGGPLAPLAAAARFALDVDGDEPSWQQLREATERAERVRELREEARDLYEQGKRDGGLGYRRRWDVYKDSTFARHVLAGGDTLEELAAAVERRD